MRIDLDANVKKAVEELDDISDNAAAGREFFRRVAKVLFLESRRLWQAQPGWPALDPDTIRKKARLGQSSRPLHATGRLERALTVWGAPGQQLKIREGELFFGLDPLGSASYGVYHQRGQGVPKRKIFDVTPRTRDRMRNELYDHILGR